MMRSGQIIKGKIDGVQQRFQSSSLPQITETRLSELTDNSQIGIFYRFFKAERIIAGMKVTEAENSDGRPGGVIKQIILYQYDRTTTLDGEQYLFDFEEYIAKLPRTFKIPSFPETLENPLPPPSPLEWEV
jgi:hypothetical protein